MSSLLKTLKAPCSHRENPQRCAQGPPRIDPYPPLPQQALHAHIPENSRYPPAWPSFPAQGSCWGAHSAGPAQMCCPGSPSPRQRLGGEQQAHTGHSPGVLGSRTLGTGEGSPEGKSRLPEALALEGEGTWRRSQCPTVTPGLCGATVTS